MTDEVSIHPERESGEKPGRTGHCNRELFSGMPLCICMRRREAARIWSQETCLIVKGYAPVTACIRGTDLCFLVPDILCPVFENRVLFCLKTAARSSRYFVV